MSFPTDLEIARTYQPIPVERLAKDLGIDEKFIIPYGSKMAKVHYKAIEASQKNRGKLVLVTAITPTPAGEGKTTTSIGLAQGMKKIGKNVSVALREPSMGPLFGIKGGATGGGYAQVVPMEEINLQFTGDFAAITEAHNLIAAALDNAMHHRKIKNVDTRKLLFPRVVDLNDRALRNIVLGLGGKTMGIPRENHFNITAASEVMAIFCLSKNYQDLKERINRILVGMTYDDEPLFAEPLKVAGAIAVILKESLHPNLVQTMEGVPAFIHGGPFANIAHGANSILATQLSMAYSDYTITEAGFGADLGAEKFFHIPCRQGEFAPNACVVVATIRALKMHGGIEKNNLTENNAEAVAKGLANLDKHIENMQQFKKPVVVAINKFADDSEEEIKVIEKHLQSKNIPFALASHFTEGGNGCIDLAEKVAAACEEGDNVLYPLYELEWSVEKKIKTIAQKIYGASDVEFLPKAKKDLKMIYDLNLDQLAICMAKTPMSFSDDPKKIGRPENFTITIRNIEIASGAGFIVPITGDVMRMPGLPKQPAFEKMDINENDEIVGLS